MNQESPLWMAIKSLRRAKREKLHKKIIGMLEERVSREARKVVDVLNYDPRENIPVQQYIEIKYIRDIIKAGQLAEID